MHTMKNVHVHEYCLGWHVYTYYPYRAGQCKKEGKGIVYRYKPMKAIKRRSKECFVVSDFFY